MSNLLQFLATPFFPYGWMISLQLKTLLMEKDSNTCHTYFLRRAKQRIFGNPAIKTKQTKMRKVQTSNLICFLS